MSLADSVEEMDMLQKLYHLLQAKGFQTRLEGVALLPELCKSSPQLISKNIVQIFYYFVLRICDSHKKVRQKALDVLAEIIGLLDDAMNPVMIRLVEGIAKNLSSSDPGVHAAAVRALEESVAHLDPCLHGAWWVRSCASLPAELVEWVYARSPEVVQRYALPVLWSFLDNKALPVRSANIRTVATKLALALYEAMGNKLKKCAASKQDVLQEDDQVLSWTPPDLTS
uniref:TOG domain-containing protein n=1 Tax=Taeniopygia guttata TaxID=59729 RepID=A0A674HNY7_TAEGU